MSTNIVCGQERLDAKLDSIETIVNSDSFNDDYKPIVEYLKTIKSDCLASNSRLTKVRFLNCYGAALYFTQDYDGCIPVLKNYIKVIEDDQVSDMSSEENLSVYEALGRSQFLIGEIDEAYTTTRRALLYFDTVLDKYAAGYQIYDLFSQICEARKDTVMAYSNAVVYGGVNYEETIGEMVAESKRYKKRVSLENQLAIRGKYMRDGWQPLPGTLKEAESISSLLTDKRITVRFLKDNKANEESFKNLSGNSPDILYCDTWVLY